MTLKQFLREKVGWIFGIAFQLFLVTVFGKAFQVNSSFLACVYFMELLVLFLMWGNDFQKRRAFYNDMQKKLDDLDKKYLLTEMIEPPGFLEGDIFCETLYETNKSMNEWVGERERSVKEFKDYVEMWIHEIKLPISALSLMNYNEKTDIRLYRPQIEKISHYVEQILYYVRADAPQKDFLMTRCCLKKLIQEVLLEHKDKIPYDIVFVKNKYIGRTFIQNSQNKRKKLISLKLNPLHHTVKGKKIVLVDDSIVRGNTLTKIIKTLKDAGAKEVHIRIASPAFVDVCYFGTDIDKKENLIANNRTVEEIRQMIGADSLEYMNLDSLKEIAKDCKVKGFCDGCFTGKYPIEVPKNIDKDKFEKLQF